VRLVLAAAVTELLELQTPRGRLLVLRRRVIPLLAHLALQCNNFPHVLTSQTDDFSLLVIDFDSNNELPAQEEELGWAVALQTQPHAQIFTLLDIRIYNTVLATAQIKYAEPSIHDQAEECLSFLAQIKRRTLSF